MRVCFVGPRDTSRTSGLRAALAAPDFAALVAVNAVSPVDPPSAFSARRSRAYNPRVLTLAELGCVHAQKNTNRRVTAGPDNCAFVLENDAVITNIDRLRGLLDSMSCLLLLESGAIVSLFTPDAAPNSHDVPSNRWDCSRQHSSAVAYCLDCRADQKARRRLMEGAIVSAGIARSILPYATPTVRWMANQMKRRFTCR